MADPARPSNYLLDYWVYARSPEPVPAPNPGKFLIFSNGAPDRGGGGKKSGGGEKSGGGGGGGGNGGNGGDAQNDDPLSPLDRAWRRITQCIADGRIPCSGAKCSTLLAALPFSLHGGGGGEGGGAAAAEASGGGGGSGGGRKRRALVEAPSPPPPPPPPLPPSHARRTGVICVYCPDWRDPFGVLETGVALQRLVGYGERRLLVFKRDEETERGAYSRAGLEALGAGGGAGGGGEGGGGGFGGGGGGSLGVGGPPGPAFYHYKGGVLRMAYGDKPAIAAYDGDPSYQGGFN